MPEEKKTYAKLDLNPERPLQIGTFSECVEPLLITKWLWNGNVYLSGIPNHIYLNSHVFPLPIYLHHKFYITQDTIIESGVQESICTGSCSFHITKGATVEFRNLHLGDIANGAECSFVLEPNATIIFTDCYITGHLNEHLITVLGGHFGDDIGDVHIIFQGCRIEDQSTVDVVNIHEKCEDINLTGSLHIIFDDSEYLTNRLVIHHESNYPNVSIRVDTCVSPAEDLKTSE